MEIYQGSTRTVVALPLFGIAIKIPKIHCIQAVCSIWEVIFRYKTKLRLGIFLLKYKLSFPADKPTTIPGKLFAGIINNWREWRLFRKTKHPFLQPTIISAFGLINIQRYGKPYSAEIKQFAKIMGSLLGNDMLIDHHHMVNPNNFTLANGQLKIMDYGSRNIAAILAKHGDKLSNVRMSG